MTLRQYVHFSSAYFFVFILIGAVAPFLPLFLNLKGFDSEAIGQMMAMILAAKVGIPNLLSTITDKQSCHRLVIRCCALLVILAFWLLGKAELYWEFMLLIFLYGVGMATMLPQYEAITLDLIDNEKHRYTQIRLWGSIGFIVASMILGYLIERLGVEHLMMMFLVIALLNMVGAFSMPSLKNIYNHDGSKTSIFTVLAHKEVMILFIVNFLLYMSHGPYYSFFSIYLTEHHYSGTMIGWLWSLGVIAEVIIFIFVPALLVKYGSWQLMKVCLLLTTLRWCVIAFYPEYFWVLSSAQLLHAASFAVIHGITVYLIVKHFVGGTQSRGQALYNTVGFGMGSTSGSLLAGYTWESLGATQTYLWAAFVSFIALAIVVAGLRFKNSAALSPSSP